MIDDAPGFDHNPPSPPRDHEDAMTERDEARLDRHFARMQARLPSRVSRFLQWLRRPSSRWVRIPLGVVLIVAGIFSVLPVLGLWMLPLGLLLLAQDLPFLRRPMRLALDWLERKWLRWKASHRHRPR